MRSRLRRGGRESSASVMGLLSGLAVGILGPRSGDVLADLCLRAAQFRRSPRIGAPGLLMIKIGLWCTQGVSLRLVYTHFVCVSSHHKHPCDFGVYANCSGFWVSYTPIFLGYTPEGSGANLCTVSGGVPPPPMAEELGAAQCSLRQWAHLQVVSYSGNGGGDVGQVKRKAMVEDLASHHDAFLRRGETSASFRPKQQHRSSVVKVLSLIDNQVPCRVTDGGGEGSS